MFFRSVVIILILLLITSFTSCYYLDSDKKTDYGDFCKQMKKINPYLYDFFPKEDSKDNIVSSYWYYSDYDLIDSFYTIYLACEYGEEQYKNEYERLLEHCEEGMSDIDSSEFDYSNITIQHLVSYDSIFDTVYINSIYALFDNELKQIIYVAIFNKDDYSNVLNIPEKYLPKDYLQLNQTNQ